ncbi:uncharacterized protein LOC143877592 [Tasmannia lanceolata]|uniref:uncharacterized protein LOC143877592 n=1 Tax=Tasmannia lanceolata TaxID=3420 RepID=UPI0040630704
MRSRRPGGGRDRSPPPAKIRDHRSEWRSNPYHGGRGKALHSPRRASPRSLSPMGRERNRRALGGGDRSHSPMGRERNRRALGGGDRSLSPMGRERIRRALGGGDRSLSPMGRERIRRPLHGGDHRSTSVERRDYNRHLNSDGNRDIGFDRLRQSPSGLSRNGLQLQDQFPYRDSSSGKLRHEYFLPEPPASLDIKPNHKDHHIGISGGGGSSRANKDKDFQGNGALGLDGHGMLVQKSMCLDDGSVRTFFTLPPDAGCSSGPALNLGNLNIGFHEDEHLRHHDSLHLSKMTLRESYEEENKSFYPRDASYHSIPSSQSKAYGHAASGLGREDFFGSYRDGMHPQSGGFGRSNEKFSDPLDSDGYGRTQLFESRNGPDLPSKDPNPYQRVPLSPARDEPRDYGYPELSRRDRGDASFLSDELYKNVQPGARGDYAHRGEPSGSTFMDLVGDRIVDTETSRRNLREGGVWDHHSLPRDPIPKYHDLNPSTMDRYGDFLGSRSTNLEFGTKTSQENGIMHFGKDYDFGRDAGPVDYRGRLKSPPLLERDLDIYRLDASAQRRSNAEEIGVYDTSERTLKRKYVVDEMNRHNPRSTGPSNLDTFGRIQELGGSDEPWIGQERVRLLPSKKLGLGHTQNRMPGRLFNGSPKASVSDAWQPPEDVPARAKGRLTEFRLRGGRDINIKSRLRPGSSDSHGSFPFDNKQEFRRPYKFRKGHGEDRHGSANEQRHGYRNEHVGDPLKDAVVRVKSDPPEGSEEFSQQVHRVFLRFSKHLYENPAQQRRYQEQGKFGSLLCSVCGSHSKEFVDTHSLVTHAFHSLKVGLRTDHLGLHKAMCVMMGWSSLVAPDTGKAYQSMPVSEASALKEDLILWPPLVIIHNSSMENKNTNAHKVITNERMGEILKEMGFGGGKGKVCRGKPANQSILLVKYNGTFSGLQEAERLHKYYVENKRGRKEFQRFALKDSNGGSEVKGEKVDLLLYGYLGIAEDLNKLDSETKKRCHIRSKKEIEAIADAPLKAD